MRGTSWVAIMASRALRSTALAALGAVVPALGAVGCSGASDASTDAGVIDSIEETVQDVAGDATVDGGAADGGGETEGPETVVSDTPAPSDTSVLTDTPAPSDTPAPTDTPTLTDTPDPDDAPDPNDTPIPADTTLVPDADDGDAPDGASSACDPTPGDWYCPVWEANQVYGDPWDPVVIPSVSLARSATGTTHLAFYSWKYAGTSNPMQPSERTLLVTTGTDFFGTWTPQTLASGDDLVDPSHAPVFLDAESRPHVLFVRGAGSLSGDLFEAVLADSGTMAAPVKLTQFAASGLRHPLGAISADDTLHAVFFEARADGAQAVYLQRLADGTVSQEPFSDPVHVSSGPWVVEAPPLGLTLGPDGSPHVVLRYSMPERLTSRRRPVRDPLTAPLSFPFRVVFPY